MYGKVFRAFPIDRIIEELTYIKATGTRGVFLTDDNIIFAPNHFTALCEAIIKHGLNDLYYSVQLSAAGIAKNPELIALMDKANFRSIFVGFESMLESNLKDMSKPTSPAINKTAAQLLRQNNMAIFAGVIAGYPDDTRETISENFRKIGELKPDALYAQYLTPYPKTEVRKDMLAEGLITNVNDLSLYDGFTCNIRTHHLSNVQLFKALKCEAFRFLLDPRIRRRDLYLRHFRLDALLVALMKTIGSDLYNILTGKRYATQLDI